VRNLTLRNKVVLLFISFYSCVRDFSCALDIEISFPLLMMIASRLVLEIVA